MKPLLIKNKGSYDTGHCETGNNQGQQIWLGVDLKTHVNVHACVMYQELCLNLSMSNMLPRKVELGFTSSILLCKATVFTVHLLQAATTTCHAKVSRLTLSDTPVSSLSDVWLVLPLICLVPI